MIPLRRDMKVLDYGCGDGGFFEELNTRVPVENLFGFDPYLLPEMTMKGPTTYDDVGELTRNHLAAFDAVYCMEVCEHLTDAALHDLFRNIRTVAKPDAVFVFGVPIETGLPGLIKNAYRVARGGRQGATVGKALKSLLALSIPRANDERGWIGSHIGFDYAYFRDMLDYGGFEVIRQNCLPFQKLNCVLNNEVYFICRRNGRHK